MKQNKNTIVLIKSLIVNSTLIIIKLVAGFIGNSKAMLADAIHSLSDLGTDIISIVGSKYAQKKEDKEHPFGHGKIEYLCCLAISLVVMFLGINIVFKSLNGKATIPSDLVIIVTIVTITLKYLLSSYILKKGKEYNNSLLIASGKESKADVYSSLVVLVSALASKLAKFEEVFYYSDTIGAIILGFFVTFVGIKIFIENFATILGERENDKEIIKNIKEQVKSFKEVKEVEELVLLKFGSYYKGEITIDMISTTNIAKAYELITKIKKKLINEKTNIRYLNVIVKPYKKKVK